MYTKDVLRNSLRVITAPMSGVKSATVLIIVGAGSRYETWDNNGVAHFAEHMFFKGTNKRPSTLAISSVLDEIGGEFNAFTSKEYSGYYVKAASSHIELALDVLSDMLLNSKFDREEVNRERGVILEELRMYKDLPMRYIGTVYDSLLFGNHPLGWDTVGREESINNLNRDNFLQYLGSLYTPGNMILGMAGDVERRQSIELAERFLGNLKTGLDNKFVEYKHHQTQASAEISFKETEQAHLALGVRSYPIGHEKHYILAVLNNALGGTMSSRLFIELRERRGLGYYVRSGVDEYLDAGTLVVSAGVHKEKVDEAVKIILGEFSKIREKKIPEDELRKAKENLKGKLILELEDSKEVASLYLLQEMLEKRIRTPEELISKVDEVGSDQVLSVAKEIINEQTLNLAVIGPYRDKDSFLKLLKL